jgi:hypothetical protein
MLKIMTVAAVVVTSLIVAPSTARASAITYDFTGTLLQYQGGFGTVTGQFTLDTSGAGTITTFQFTEPEGVFNSSNATGTVVERAASRPWATFVDLNFEDNFGNTLVLLFKTPLASFDGSSFYIDTASFGGEYRISRMLCSVGGATSACADGIPGGEAIQGFDESGAPLHDWSFLSGGATPAPVPEPATLTLTALGLAAFVARYRRRPRSAS